MLFISTYNNYNYISTYLCQPLIAALLMLINTFAFIIKNNYLFIYFFLKVRYRDLPKKPNKKQFKEISSFNLSH